MFSTAFAISTSTRLLGLNTTLSSIGLSSIGRHAFAETIKLKKTVHEVRNTNKKKTRSSRS
jgi:hypothetical protein